MGQLIRNQLQDSRHEMVVAPTSVSPGGVRRSDAGYVRNKMC